MTNTKRNTLIVATIACILIVFGVLFSMAWAIRGDVQADATVAPMRLAWDHPTAEAVKYWRVCIDGTHCRNVTLKGIEIIGEPQQRTYDLVLNARERAGYEGGGTITVQACLDGDVCSDAASLSKVAAPTSIKIEAQK